MGIKKIVVVHPTGNRNVRAIISGFFNAGLLAEFDTTISIKYDAFWLCFIPGKIRQEFLRRTYPVKDELIWKHPFLELGRMLFPRIGLKSLTRHEVGLASVDSVYRNLDVAVARRTKELVKQKDIGAVYCYEDGALEVFKAAKKIGLTCVYDIPIAYWETSKSLMAEEAVRYPDWKMTLGGGTLDSKDKLTRKITELELADIVVVSSTFVKDSLPAWAKDKKIIMSPFGSPTTAKPANKVKASENNLKPLRVLFVGSMGQRKGLADLFAAINLLDTDKVELVVMGALSAPIEFYKEKLTRFTYEPGRPHEDVLKLMRSCDVFCLPSIVEGRALVMQEAMSQGLPLIITPNTGGSDLIIDGKTGFLVPIRSPQVISEKILWFLNNRDKIPAMSIASQEHANKYSWEGYSSKIVSDVQIFLADKADL